MQRGLLFLFLLTFGKLGFAQSMVEVRGIVYDADSGGVLDSVTVLVKGSSRIQRNKPDGSFAIFVKPNDTLVFGLYGYRVKYLCFKDSARDKDYFIIVKLSHFQEIIKEVSIYEARTQREIRRDMKDLNINRAYALERVDAVQSPITALYDRYSHKAQAKALLTAYEFELAKNKLVKELLGIYNKQGIIDLPQSRYREFIAFLDLDWNYLAVVSDYDLAVYVKQKAIEWTR